MQKHFPKMKTDDEVISVLNGDLAEYMSPENFAFTSFEFAPKDKSITLRLSGQLMEAVQNIAKKHHAPYQKIIRQAIENLVRQEATS